MANFVHPSLAGKFVVVQLGYERGGSMGHSDWSVAAHFIAPDEATARQMVIDYLNAEAKKKHDAGTFSPGSYSAYKEPYIADDAELTKYLSSAWGSVFSLTLQEWKG